MSSGRSREAVITQADRRAVDPERLLSLVTSGPAILYAAHAAGDRGVTFVSGNVRQLGYEQADFLDDPGFWRSRVHPDDAPRVLADRAGLSDHQVHEYRFRHADGRWRWLRDEMRLVRNDPAGTLEAI